VKNYLCLAVKTVLKKPEGLLELWCPLFWTRIYYLLKSQVEDVNAKFAALEKLKINNWKEEEKKTRKVTKKSKAKVFSVASYIINFQ